MVVVPLARLHSVAFELVVVQRLSSVLKDRLAATAHIVAGAFDDRMLALTIRNRLRRARRVHVAHTVLVSVVSV